MEAFFVGDMRSLGPRTSGFGEREAGPFVARRGGQNRRMRQLVTDLVQIPGIVTVALGSSRAAGTWTENSDWDFGLCYRGEIDTDAIRAFGASAVSLARSSTGKKSVVMALKAALGRHGRFRSWNSNVRSTSTQSIRIGCD